MATLSAFFIIIYLFSCIFFKVCICSCERLFCIVFSFRLIFHSFSKNVYTSLLLSLSGKNLGKFFLQESHWYFFYCGIFLLV